VHGLKLTERTLPSGAHEIGVEGELDLAVVEQLQEALARAGGDEVLIDLQACEFIDSSGIAVIVIAHRDGAGQGRRVVVHSPNSQVLHVLAISGLTNNGLVFESREHAAAAGANS
jgi:anti-sigma B factor antagonist